MASLSTKFPGKVCRWMRRIWSPKLYLIGLERKEKRIREHIGLWHNDDGFCVLSRQETDYPQKVGYRKKHPWESTWGDDKV